MDGDTNDSAGGVGDSLNGETKPDAAKLAQSAIIKQDVMLSGTSTQSPVSSVLTMPTVSMPTVSMAAHSMASMGATSLTGALPDSLFLSAVPSVHDHDKETGFSHGFSSQSQQLLGQPQVAAPQFIVAPQQLAAQGQAGAAAMPLQQILIPVSTGNGTQQLLSIPVSLAASAGGQIQLLTTSNGQLIATNLASLAQAPALNIAQLGNAAGAANQNSSTSTATNSLSHHTSVTAATAAGTTGHLTNSAAAAGLPQLITNAQGQIVAIGAPQVLSQTLAATQNSGLNLTTGLAQSAQTAVVSQPTLSQAQLAQHAVQVNKVTPSQVTQAQSTAVTVQQVTGYSALQNSTPTTTLSSLTSNITPNINQLLPNTVSNSTESTTVDGINLDEIKEFAKQFKIRRLSLGLTQTQVGQALSATEGPSYSQSAICRFEKLDITPKSAQKIKPVLERWMLEAEERYKNGVQNLTDFIGSEPSKKRKRRTSFTPQALEVLNEHFERNTHPSGVELTGLSEKLNYDREVIRVWFCNKRQALTNTIKKLKAQHTS